MQKLGIIIAILAIVGGGYFLHSGGCEGSVLLAGSPPVPDIPGIHIKSANGWQLVDLPPIGASLPGEYSLAFEGHSDDVIDLMGADKLGNYPMIHISGTNVQVGTRSMGIDFNIASSTYLYPMEEIQHDYYGDRYGCLARNVVGITNNLSKQEEDYTLVVMDNIPPSPTGLYLLVIMIESHVIVGNYAYIILTTN